MNRTAAMAAAEAYICDDCGTRGFGGWNCLQCGSHNIERDEGMAMKNSTVNALVARGWQYVTPYGWSHWDVRDNDGERILFDSADDAAKHIGLDQCEECGS